MGAGAGGARGKKTSGLRGGSYGERGKGRQARARRRRAVGQGSGVDAGSREEGVGAWCFFR
jgi:hypothetical protein